MIDTVETTESTSTRDLLVSASLFFGLFFGLYAIYQINEIYLEEYFAWLARSVAWALGLVDTAVGARGNVILYAGAPTLRVIEGCDGITVFILIIAAVLAFPKPFAQRIGGVLVLVPILFAINWLRLVILSAIRFYWPEHFNLVHVYLFQPVMVLATFACFIAWIAYSGRTQSGQPSRS